MIDLLGTLLFPPAWIYLPVAVVLFFCWSALGVRHHDRERRPVGPGDWVGILVGSAIMAGLWPGLVFLVVPVGVAVSLVVGLVLLMARPPWRPRPEVPTNHWVDALPERTPIEEIIERAEERA